MIPPALKSPDEEQQDCTWNQPPLEAAYREMAADKKQEQEALEWLDGIAGDVGDEPW